MAQFLSLFFARISTLEGIVRGLKDELENLPGSETFQVQIISEVTGFPLVDFGFLLVNFARFLYSDNIDHQAFSYVKLLSETLLISGGGRGVLLPN